MESQNSGRSVWKRNIKARDGRARELEKRKRKIVPSSGLLQNQKCRSILEKSFSNWLAQ